MWTKLDTFISLCILLTRSYICHTVCEYESIATKTKDHKPLYKNKLALKKEKKIKPKINIILR